MKCPFCKAENPSDAIYCGECGERIVEKLAFQETDISAFHSEETRKVSSGPRQVLSPGDVFAGRYTIAAVIGEGGMGTVYRADDRVTGQGVALKLVRADRLAGAGAVQRMIREGVTSREIRHPNVVSVYDVGEADGQPYLSMEHLNGLSLRSWTRQQMAAGAECSMQTAARIVLEILAGLEAAHAAGVVHRDLKPENVMLLSQPTDEAVRLKLLDFGIARAGGATDTGVTSTGTARYMAPEQATAPDAVQPSADLYSLSVMFYELLVGVIPQGHWQPPSGGRSDVPAGIDDLIQRGLSNAPRSRPQSAAEYRSLLETALKGGKGPKPKPGPGPKPDPRPPAPNPFANIWPPKREHWLWWGIGAAILAGAILMSDMGGDDPYVGPEGGGQVVGPVYPDPEPQPPPVQPSRLAQLSGSWYDELGNVWSISVADNGYFSGGVMSGPGYGWQMDGQINGSSVTFRVGANGVAAATLQGRLNGSDINYTDNSMGSPIRRSLHINHAPE